MKEMVGGCCVCSDERGWPENPLVYCDGQNCTVAVHQACYGIVTVPTGPWYCRKCESQERSARVRCELCPSRNGALKKTDNQGWAHVVCALYIPEVRFGNVTTMEPIILQLIPPERYAKACYICQESGKGSRANVGACMQCNKSGCKQQFHVTCAQTLGLLCEEAGNYLDNVKYCGYCQYHYSKLKKGGNVKTIPPYKPITHETNSSDATSSPEKELEPNITVATTTSLTSIKITSSQNASSAPATTTSSSSSSKQRKSSSTSKLVGSSSASSGTLASGNPPNSTGTSTLNSSSNSSNSKNNPSSSSSSKEKDKHSKSVSKVSSSSKNQEKESSSSSSSSSSTRDKTKSSKTNKDNSDHGNLSNSSITPSNTTNISSSVTCNPSTLGNTKDSLGQKFTTSNFTESVVINSESVFGSNEIVQTSSKNSSNSSSSVTKKRKSDSTKSGSIDSVDQNSSHLSFRNIIKDVSVTLVPLPMDKTDLLEIDRISKKPKPETIPSPLQQPNSEPNLQNVSPNLMGSQSGGTTITIKQQQQSVQQTGSNLQSQSSNSNSTPHIKAPILKDAAECGRLRSSSPYNSSSAALGGSGASTPSLYVSVPLSTATVPGVNLPSTTSNENVTQSQSNRASPHVNHHSHSHHHHQTSSSSSSSSSNQQPAILERQSPRQIQNLTTLASISHGLETNCSNPLSISSSNNNTVIQPSISPVSNQGTTVIGSTTASISTMESGALKITYEKQNLRTSQIQEEQIPARRSRTPDSGAMYSGTNTPFANSGSLKFTYEPQTNPIVQPISPPDGSSQSALKESPPSSPGSESGLSRKRKRKSTDSKDTIKLFHNGVHATHMLGNQLNPASSVAQKMSDQLSMEIEAHSVYTQPSMDSGPHLVGIPFPGKQSSARLSSQPNGPNSLSSVLGNSGGTGANGNTPQSLEQLLERQWEQGSQFLMEQAQHFDIASLLSCLHQLRTENVRLEEHINNLVARRDHLLAVNARLAIPLNPSVMQNPNSVNTMHLNGPTTDNTPSSGTSSSSSSRLLRQNALYNAQQLPVENGIDFRHSSHQTTSNPPNLSRHSSANSSYSSSTSSTHSQHNVLPSGRHSSHSGTSSSSNAQNPESIIRNRGTSNTSSGASVGGGGGGGGDRGGGGGSSYHSATQQSAYSTVHQSQLRRDDGQGKPS